MGQGLARLVGNFIPPGTAGVALFRSAPACQRPHATRQTFGAIVAGGSPQLAGFCAESLCFNLALGNAQTLC
jgi:hypothetical protein